MKVRPKIKRIVGLTGTPSSNGLMDLFAEFNANGVTVIVSTHEIKNLGLDEKFIANQVRQISLKNGKLYEL